MTYYFQVDQTLVARDIGPAGVEPWAQAYVRARPDDLAAEPVEGALAVEKRLDLTNWPKISMTSMAFVRRYFAEVYRLWKTEAFVLFHRGAADTDYTVISPPWYSATAGHVTYDPNVQSFCPECRIGSIELESGAACPICDDGVLVPCCIAGTAHSHGAGNAGHSSVDDANELNQTGFHITFGRVDQDKFTVAPSFVTAIPGYRNSNAKGERHTVLLEDLVDVPFIMGGLEIIQIWLNRVAHPGLAETLVASGVDPKELGVALDVDDLTEITAKANVLRFIGLMSDTERWKTRMGPAARLVTSWPVAHAALAPKPKVILPYKVGSSVSAGARLPVNQPVIGTANKTPTTAPGGGLLIKSTSIVSPRMLRKQTNQYGLVIEPDTAVINLVRLFKDSVDVSIQYLTPTLPQLLRFKDPELSENACYLALGLLLDIGQESCWFDEEPVDGDDLERVVTPLFDRSDALLNSFQSDMLDRVMLPLMDVMDELDTVEGLTTRRSRLNRYRYQSGPIAALYGDTPVATVICDVIETNLKYVEYFGLRNANADFLEWLRILGVVLQVVSKIALTNIHTKLLNATDEYLKMISELPEILDDPDDANHRDVLAEDRAGSLGLTYTA